MGCAMIISPVAQCQISHTLNTIMDFMQMLQVVLWKEANELLATKARKYFVMSRGTVFNENVTHSVIQIKENKKKVYREQDSS